MTYDTRTVQERLASLGFDPGPVDGIRGPRTDAAIVAFKRSIGLRARPYIGPLTYEALFGEPLGGDLPWLQEARAIMGLHERRDTARLRRWFDSSVSWIDPREVAWCGAFVATAMRKAIPGIELPDNPLGARNWSGFGLPAAPQLGAVLAFWRVSRSSWQGHVGLYWGEDDTAFHVLGGNQSDAVTITRVAKRRLLGARWPIGFERPGTRVFLSRKGVPLSQNEA